MFIHFHVKYYYFLYIGIGFRLGRYEKSYIGILSVSADKKIGFIGLYWYHFLEQKPPSYLKVNYRACDRLIFKRNNKLVSIPGYVLQSCQELCARDQVFLSRLISRT